MRASHLKSNLEALRDLGPDAEARVRAAVPEVVREVEEAVRVAWLPLELDVRLTEAVERATDEERLRAWGRDAIARSAEGPLLRPILAALERLGLTPHVALKRVPHGWSLIYRDCGEIGYERLGEREAVLVQDDAPEAMLRSEPYVIGIAGAFDGVMALSGGHGGRAEIAIEPAARRVRYTCRWR